MKDFTQSDIKRMAASKLVPASTPIRRITIGKPRIEMRDGKAFQWCTINVGDIERDVYFSVDEEYGQYLCHERGDAYLIGLLNFAMRERCDIHSDAPLTGELVHQIQTELIASVVTYSQGLYAPVITGELTDEPLPSARKVATGCSCGVDSLNAIKCMCENLDGRFKPDYLVVNNVGAYTSGGKLYADKYDQNAENARQCAKELDIPLIVTDSNFSEAIPQKHLLTHVYSSSFAVYMLRKLWHRYYYASPGTRIQDRFKIVHNDYLPPCQYDLIALPAFSISQLRICNESITMSRFEKMRNIADYPIAHKYLSVCLKQGKGHCGTCPKCKRTLWILDALGKLDNFTEIFDIAAYRAKRKHYLQNLYIAYRKGVGMTEDSYAILKKEISPFSKLIAWGKQALRMFR